MKKIIKYICVFILLIFSFYYTNYVSNLIINKSTLMKQINENKSLYEKTAINGIISDNTIVPGIDGVKVNEKESYNAMKENNAYSSDLFVYDHIKSAISIEDNKNLIIIHGNELKNKVSIVVGNNLEILNYSIENNIKINRLINKDTFSKTAKYEQINNDSNTYEDVEKKLDSINANKNLCIINASNMYLCMDYNKYLIKPNVEVRKDTTFLTNDIKSGDIIYISDDIDTSKYKLLLSKIYYHKYEIVYLDELISETMQ